MTTANLDVLFNPRSVALIGASNRPRTVGNTVMRNLLAGGFDGPIMPVNPKYTAVAGVLAYPTVAALPQCPDLAIIATPPHTVPGLIDQLGDRGCKVAVVLTAGLQLMTDGTGQTLLQAMVTAARRHAMRILGHNTVGLATPSVGLNASFAQAAPLPGDIAFVTQSGALATVVLDWANAENIGFSHFVSLGNCADIDFGDLLTYLQQDEQTRAVLLYMEAIQDAPKFMAAAQTLAATKPIIAVKAGRAAAGAQAAASHTGALAGADDSFAAALRRAGILRVDAIEDLFNALETLNRARPVQGDRLTIFTNGGGAGVMAADAVGLRGGHLATLAPATLARLNAFLPSTWSHGNPVDIVGDATPERFVQTLRVLLDDPATDAILFLQAPSAIVPAEAIAAALVPVMQASDQNILTCWLGKASTAPARRLCAEAGIPVYDTPEDGVEAFLQMVEHHAIRQALLTRPAATPALVGSEGIAAGRAVIEQVQATGRRLLTEPEAKTLLAAYAIPTVACHVAATPAACAEVATAIGFPVVLKILSPTISHKSDVGGVALNLQSPQAVHAAAGTMIERVRTHAPNASLDGFTVQAMVQRPHAHELIVGVTTDPIIGPVLLFGQGGVAVEAIGDRAVELPPLTQPLAQAMIDRTRVARLLAGYRNQPPADRTAIGQTLLKLAQLIADLPMIREIDINPLLADEQGVLALDARVLLDEGMTQ